MASAALSVEQVGATVGKGVRVDSEKNIFGKQVLPEAYSSDTHGNVIGYVADGAIATAQEQTGTVQICKGKDLRMTTGGVSTALLHVVLTSAESGNTFQLDAGGDDFEGLGTTVQQYLQNTDAQVGDYVKFRGNGVGIWYIEECQGKWSISAASL